MDTTNSFIVSEFISIQEAVRKISSDDLRTLIVCRDNQVLGTVTDRDIREAILLGLDKNDSVLKIANKNFIKIFSNDTRLMFSEKRDLLLEQYSVNIIPIVDNNFNYVDFIIKNKSIYSYCPVVIMCGGLGLRMGEYTKTCPKPMLPIHGKPMLEHILVKLRNAHFKKFYFAVNYLGNVIEDYFQDGANFDVEITYLREKKRLGTGGALSLITEDINTPIIVMNGDIITDFNFRNFLDFHISVNAFASIVVSEYQIQNPFGVVELNGNDYISMVEKPIYRSYINAGIYAIHPNFLKIVPKDDFVDMPTLLDKAKSLNKDIKVYPIVEGWHDIGRVSDYLDINKEGVY